LQCPRCMAWPVPRAWRNTVKVFFRRRQTTTERCRERPYYVSSGMLMVKERALTNISTMPASTGSVSAIIH
jgi:NMD protein affecting ribosome stability and mRNA decay